MIETIFSVLTTGAGGGIIGGILGLFKQHQETKKEIAHAKINLQRDEMEYRNAEAERVHALTMLEKGAQIELEKVQTETEAEIEVANQKALGNAQRVFANLNTTSGMDNYRASVRPTLAYWAIALFSAMLVWAFYRFNGLVTQEIGLGILTDLFGTLTFTMSSVVTFYYVARRNNAPR